MEQDNYGFIITRHVNSILTNKYWNQNIKLIRTFYPNKKIVIIDDNSNQAFVKADHDYKNIITIQSEYKGRGELLSFIYLLRHKWFKNAVIIHDSTFIHKRMPFELMKTPILPFWHHPYDKENEPNVLRILSALQNNWKLRDRVYKATQFVTLGMNTDSFDLCFGNQCYINLRFLEVIESKYKLTNLLRVVHNRTDRCSLERVMGLIFNEEYYNLKKVKSLFGMIHHFPNAFKYNYGMYQSDLMNKKKMPNAFVKVWTGR